MRIHLYVSHSFDHADKYERILEFVRGEGVPIADFSVPVWRQIEGDEDAVKTAIAERIRRSNRVLVLLTDGLHRSPYVEFEVSVARELGKPIIGVYPHGRNGGSIPVFVADGFYKNVGWTRGSIGRALRLEYPAETRVFDLAEVEERREIVTHVGIAAGTFTAILAGFTVSRYLELRNELAARGIEIVDDAGPSLLATVAQPTAIGAVVGTVAMGAMFGTKKAMLTGAAIGGGIGAAVGVRRHYRARIEMLGGLVKLQLVSGAS
jgi:hypothetical protein